MKYFVAYLLSGDAKRYHEQVTRELSKRFGIVPLHKKAPPHVTLKIPFETDERGIAEVHEVLRVFAKGRSAPPLSFSGFGRFGFKTVYLNAPKSPESVTLARECVSFLNGNILWLPRQAREGNKLHASVARFLTRKQFRRVWRTLRGAARSFETHFNNITILIKKDTVWKVHSIVPLTLPMASLRSDVRFKRKTTLVS